MSRIGWPRNQQESVVACHVRRGDKVGGGRTGRFVIDMGMYKKELGMMVRQTAANIVYVGGDDQETVSEMAAFARNELGVTALFDDLESRSSKDNSAMMTLSHKVNITHYALDAICNGDYTLRQPLHAHASTNMPAFLICTCKTETGNYTPRSTIHAPCTKRIARCDSEF
jgi:hypothetical protein